MEREGYVTKVRESTGTGEEDIYWVVGPRGKVEVGEEGVRGLVKAVYGGEEVQELERRVERSLGAGMKVERQEFGDGRRRERKRKRRGEEEDDGGQRGKFLKDGEDEEESDDDDDDDLNDE